MNQGCSWNIPRHPSRQYVAELADDYDVEDGDDEERDGEADSDVEQQTFYASSCSVDSAIRATEYAS